MTQPLLLDWKELQPLTGVMVLVFALVNLIKYVSRTERGVEKLLHAMVKNQIKIICNHLHFSNSHRLSTSC